MKVLKHFGWFYLFYFIIFPLRDFLTGGEWEELYKGYISFKSFWLESTTVLCFYAYAGLIHYVLTQYYKSESKKWLFLIPLTIIAPIVLRYFIQEFLSPILFGFSNYFGTVSSRYYFKDNLYYAIIFLLFGLCYFYFHYAQDQQRKQYELSIVNRKLHLDQLRSQMNGHFLFNTLNGLYALFQMKDDRAAPYLEKLNGLFQYSLYEPNRMVSLDKELKHLTSFIDLQSIRSAQSSFINIDISAEPSVKLPQFLLFPLVENAFKHGDLAREYDQAVLSITTTDSVLDIQCKNRKAQRNKDQIGGIGLQNVKERLDLLYAGQASIDIEEDFDYFTVRIKLPLYK